jgi:hypothetical protein
MERDNLTRLFCRCCTSTLSSHKCTVVDVTAARLDSTRPTSPPRTSIRALSRRLRRCSTVVDFGRWRTSEHRRPRIVTENTRHTRNLTHGHTTIEPRQDHAATNKAQIARLAGSSTNTATRHCRQMTTQHRRLSFSCRPTPQQSWRLTILTDHNSHY